jgi:hypothetical protein
MSADSDPPRLSELGGEGSPELRGLFQNARNDVPSSSKLEGLWARIEPLTVPTPGTSPMPPASPIPASAGSGAGAAKLAGVLAAVGAAGLLAYFLTRPETEAPKPQAPVVSAPVADVSPDPTPATAEPAPVAKAPTSATSAPDAKAHVEARGTQAPSSSKATDASAEAALLERAREAIATDPKRALALTREHARRFPKGILAQEREVIAIDALKRLGKGSEAESRADQFKKSYPGSAHQHGLDSATNQR